MFEIIGIIGTIFTVISLTQSDMVKLRVINSIGSVIFIIYGFLIKSPSVIISNVCILFINIRRLLNNGSDC